MRGPIGERRRRASLLCCWMRNRWASGIRCGVAAWPTTSRGRIEMGRVPELEPASLSEEQLRIYGEIAAKRHGTVRGPFAIWLRDPKLADRANAFGNALRSEGRLE